MVPSTVNLCLGSGCPILAYNTNFFETFDKEIIKYTGLGEALVDLFEESEKVKETLRIAEQYVRENSSYEIAKRFVELFEFLPEMTEKRALA